MVARTWNPRLALARCLHGFHQPLYQPLDQSEDGRSGRTGKCRAAGALRGPVASNHLAHRRLPGETRLATHNRGSRFEGPREALAALPVIGAEYRTTGPQDTSTSGDTGPDTGSHKLGLRSAAVLPLRRGSDRARHPSPLCAPVPADYTWILRSRSTGGGPAIPHRPPAPRRTSLSSQRTGSGRNELSDSPPLGASGGRGPGVGKGAPRKRGVPPRGLTTGSVCCRVGLGGPFPS